MKKVRFFLLALSMMLIVSGMAMAGGGKQAATSGDGDIKAGTYTWIAGGMGGGWYTVWRVCPAYSGERAKNYHKGNSRRRRRESRFA